MKIYLIDQKVGKLCSARKSAAISIMYNYTTSKLHKKHTCSGTPRALILIQELLIPRVYTDSGDDERGVTSNEYGLKPYCSAPRSSHSPIISSWIDVSCFCNNSIVMWPRPHRFFVNLQKSTGPEVKVK